MKLTRLLLICGILLSMTAFIACGPSRSVKRTAVDTTVDLSGRWNDTDARLVAEEMVKDSLSKPWLMRFNREEGRRPVVIVGLVRNRSSEHIETAGFVNDIERELINSGEVRFVASAKQREEIRRELESQQSYASEETMKRLASETGADFMMQGVITSTVDAVSGKRVVLYQVDMELISIETTEKVWIGTKKIKKVIEQKSVGW
ncbi:MAG TPA: penicillin-binding protein activator LpoB [Spirochaetia bacterium]|nr:penicillin-binding protein activator LpoB [Spirochaetia bacterium]